MKPTIIVPFDFSVEAERALAWAADFQRTTGAAPLQIVHAISSRPAGSAEVGFDMLLPSAEETETLQRNMLETARRVEAAATATVLVRTGQVADIILDAARSAGAGLIVIGSHGRTGIKRLLLGSVAEHVVRHADCPVVTVRGAARK